MGVQAAAHSLRAIGASFCQLVTSTMVSRLVLNLRSPSNLPKTATNISTTYPMMRLSGLTDLVVGNLGEELDGLDKCFDDDSYEDCYTESGEDERQREEYLLVNITRN